MTPLDQALDGIAPDSIMLMRLMGEAPTEEEARSALARAVRSAEASSDADALARLRRLQTLWAAHPQAWSIVRSTLATIAHDRRDRDPDAVLRYWAAAFDRLADGSPEASVALYSLGSPALLAAATDEIVAFMQSLALLRQDRDALDVGCGIGRLCVALSPHLRTIRGMDIAARMVEQARARCTLLANVRIDHSDGRDLGVLPDKSLDLVLAADVFPYLVGAGGGLAEHHIREFRRVLRPGGAALILNYAYRGDHAADRRDVAAAAVAADLVVERNGTADLRLWDGKTFLLRRPV